MKYRAWHIDESPNDGETYEASDAGQASGMFAHDRSIDPHEIECVPLLAAPVEVELSDGADFIVPGMEKNDATDYLRLFNGAARMMQFLHKVVSYDIEHQVPAITGELVAEATHLSLLILGEVPK